MLTTAEAEAEAMQSVVDRAGIPESLTPAAAARVRILADQVAHARW